MVNNRNKCSVSKVLVFIHSVMKYLWLIFPHLMSAVSVLSPTGFEPKPSETRGQLPRPP